MIRQPILLACAFVLWAGIAVGTPGPALAQAVMPSGADRILVAGRDGWVIESDDEQAILRIGLSDPDAPPGRSAGLMVLVCEGRSRRLHFTLDSPLYQRVRGNVPDGYAHFVAGGPDTEGPDAVSFYVGFPHATTFRSRPSVTISQAESLPRLVDLLGSAGRTVTLHLRPRPPQGRFEPGLRLLLILEPGDGPLPMSEALATFVGDCARRR